jgi:hypothetical protein
VSQEKTGKRGRVFQKLKCPVAAGVSLFEMPCLFVEENFYLQFVNSPCLHPVFGPPFTPLTPLLVVSAKYGHLIKSQFDMLKLSTKSWISAFNAQGSRGTTVPILVGAVKICVAPVEAIRKKKKDRVKLRKPKLMVSWVSHPHHPPPLNPNVHCFLISPCVWPNSAGGRGGLSLLE